MPRLLLTKNGRIALCHGPFGANVAGYAQEYGNILPFAEPLWLQPPDEKIRLLLGQGQAAFPKSERQRWQGEMLSIKPLQRKPGACCSDG